MIANGAQLLSTIADEVLELHDRRLSTVKEVGVVGRAGAKWEDFILGGEIRSTDTCISFEKTVLTWRNKHVDNPDWY